MTDDMLDKLERLADKATPGEWYASMSQTPANQIVCRNFNSFGFTVFSPYKVTTNGQPNLKYIAAMNPETTKYLINRIRKLEAVRGVTKHAYEYLKGFVCEENCDPSVGFHEPECCIAEDFRKALNAYDEWRKEQEE